MHESRFWLCFFGGFVDFLFQNLSEVSYLVINVTWLLQVHLPSALADGLIKYLSLWTLVPFLKTLYLGEMWLKPKKNQLVNRQLKQTANEPVTDESL